MRRENGAGLRSLVNGKTLGGTIDGCATKRSGQLVSVAEVGDVEMSLMKVAGGVITRLTGDSGGLDMQMVWQARGKQHMASSAMQAERCRTVCRLN